MKNSDEAMKVTIIFYVKNKIEIDVIRRLIIIFQSGPPVSPFTIFRYTVNKLIWFHLFLD